MDKRNHGICQKVRFVFEGLKQISLIFYGICRVVFFGNTFSWRAIIGFFSKKNIRKYLILVIFSNGILLTRLKIKRA